jgi:hypothetical protein
MKYTHDDNFINLDDELDESDRFEGPVEKDKKEVRKKSGGELVAVNGKASGAWTFAKTRSSLVPACISPSGVRANALTALTKRT